MNSVRKPNSKAIRGWVVAVTLVVVAVGGSLVWANSPSHVRVLWAHLDRNTTLTVHANTNSCFGELSVKIHETSDQVRVAVFDQRFRVRFGEGGCSDPISFTLAGPLGNRVLIDEVTDQPIRILPP